MLCEKNQNMEFFQLMQKYFQTICTCFLKLEHMDWRTKKEVFITFRKAELLYKGDNFVDKAFTIVVKNLKEEQNYKLQEECARQIMFMFKHANSLLREDISLLCYEYFNSTNFYNRRLFIPMFEEALDLFSMNFLKKSMLFSYYLDLVNNDHSLILNKLIRLLPRIVPLVNHDQKVRYKINAAIGDLKGTVDMETISVSSLINIVRRSASITNGLFIMKRIIRLKNLRSYYKKILKGKAMRKKIH